MSESQRVEGNRVFCYACNHEWDRSRGGLQCPACESEFVEIIDSTTRHELESSPPPIPHYSRPVESPSSPSPFHDFNPWAPESNNDGFTTYQFHTPGGRGTFSFASTTYTIGGGSARGPNNVATDEIGRNFETMLGNIMGYNTRRLTMMPGSFFEFPPHRNERGFGTVRSGPAPDLFSMLFQGVGSRSPMQQSHPLEILGAMLNSANGRRGDTVLSQEAFDRVMTQLMEQNSSNAPGPASESAISALRRKRLDKEMMGGDGTAECSICMDSLQIGDEVTVLPCNHWFHGDCVISWLREHDTCPHCRQPTTSTERPVDPPSASRRRRSSRRSSSVASPLSPSMEGHSRSMASFQDSPSGLREARQQYYANSRTHESDIDRPSHRRRSSDRSPRPGESSAGSGGGVAGWIRSRLPFSGQQ